MLHATDPTRRRWLAPEVVQTSSMDCGPASLKCLLEGYGIAASYGRLREACQTDVDGTSIDVIEAVANQLGLHAEQVMLPVDHLFLDVTQTLPAVMVVRQPDGANHFVVVWRRHGAWLQIMDPAIGRRWVDSRKFVHDIFRHELNVAAAQWRDWAVSEEAMLPLRHQLAKAGLGSASAQTLIEKAKADPLWFGLATLDASVRFVLSIVQAGGLPAGAQTARLVATLFEQTCRNTDDIYNTIPALYWAVLPRKSDPDGERQLTLRGAVLVRVKARQASAEQPQGASPDASPNATESTTERSVELTAALTEKPLAPLATIWSFLKMDGVLSPLALVGAIGIAATVVVIEMFLFRGIFGISSLLTLPSQRMAAVLALLVFVGLLLTIEVPILSESMRMGRHLETRLRMALLDKLPRLNDRYFQSRPISDMADRSHSSYMTRLIPGMALHFLQAWADLALTLIGIAVIAPASLGAALVIALVAITLPFLVQPFLNERDLRVRNHSGALNVFYLDALLGLTPIRAHQAQDAVRRQHEGLLVEWAKSSRRWVGFSLLSGAFQSLVCFGMAGYLLTRHFVQAGSATGADLLLVFWVLKLPSLGRELTALAQQYPGQRNVLLRLLEPITATIENEPEVAPPLVLQSPGIGIEICNGKVIAAGHTLLDEIDLRIAPSEHIAIVGLSGAGKSTLFGLLLGWHRLAQGQLHLDGVTCGAQAPTPLRRETAWVDPAIQVWNQSFLDNLTYASDQDQLQSLSQVLDAAQLRGVLQKLPDGLQTLLGEGGGLLSGGEGQRVRLARALLQPHARLVLLDEPFRGMDRTQRARFLTEARRWWKDATLLCITHDIEETRSFDRVLVIEGGRIVEDNAPAVLEATASRYRTLRDTERSVRERLWSSAQWRHLTIDQGSLRSTASDAAPSSGNSP